MKHMLYACVTIMLGMTPGMHTILPAQLNYTSYHTAVAPAVDGIADEPCWDMVEWFPIDVEWFSNAPACPPEDFSGRFKAVWTTDRFYLLVEIIDDTLVEYNADPLYKYWEDDCLEIFIDEDRSGGNHKYNHQSFAYHISAITRNIVDLDIDAKPKLFNHHADVAIVRQGNTYTWEIGLLIFGDNYVYGMENTPLTLYAGKEMGLSLAYCDNDGTGRENFIGTEPGGLDSWIDASLFGKVTLVMTDTTTTGLGSLPDNDWNIYPNPTVNNVNIVPPYDNKQAFGIEVFDFSGKRHMTETFDGLSDIYSVTLHPYFSGNYVILSILQGNTRKSMIIQKGW